MKELLPVSKAPELIFGLVAPIGVDLDLVAEMLSQSLKEMNYQAHQFRVTKLMREIPTGLTIAEKPYIQSFKDRIAYEWLRRGVVLRTHFCMQRGSVISAVSL